MSVAAVSRLASPAPASSDAGKAAKGKPDAGTAFAAMIAGAKPATIGAATSRDARSGDKTRHAQRDDDSTRDGDDRDAVADGTTPASPQATATAPIPAFTPAPAAAATDTSPGKPGKQGADGSGRDTTTVAATSTDRAEAGVDLTQSAIDTTDPKLAPVLAALADSLAAKQASDQPIASVAADPAPVVQNTVAAPVIPATATAALMASRLPSKDAPFSGSADARVPASSRKTADDADADAPAATSDPATGGTVTPLTVATNPGGAPVAHAPATIAEGAASQLAAGAADRQLDLAKQGAWLDGLSHDIAAAGAGSGPLRFEVAPQHLGAVQVEMTRDGNGATVTLTASSEAGRVALADARPQLIAEARSNGIHIASAQIDVGNGQAGSSDSRQPSSGQNDSRPSAHSSSGSGGFSAQADAQGQSGRQSQTRSQPLAAKPVSSTGSPDANPAPGEPTDGLYA